MLYPDPVGVGDRLAIASASPRRPDVDEDRFSRADRERELLPLERHSREGTGAVRFSMSRRRQWRQARSPTMRRHCCLTASRVATCSRASPQLSRGRLVVLEPLPKARARSAGGSAGHGLVVHARRSIGGRRAVRHRWLEDALAQAEAGEHDRSRSWRLKERVPLGARAPSSLGEALSTAGSDRVDLADAVGVVDRRERSWPSFCSSSTPSKRLGCMRIEFETDALNERLTSRPRCNCPRSSKACSASTCSSGTTATPRDSAWFTIVDDDWPQE